MWALSVVVTERPLETGAQVRVGLEGAQVDALVLRRAPEPLNEDVVHPTIEAVHVDPCAGPLEDRG